MATVAAANDKQFAPKLPPNYLGATGFCISLIALLFTFGILSPLGLIISFCGLFSKNRGFACAGFIMGLIGTLFICTIVGGAVAFAVNIQHQQQLNQQMMQTDEAMHAASVVIEDYVNDHRKLPEGIEGNKMVLSYVDGFGTELRYDLESRSRYTLLSAGEDRQFDTYDDIRLGTGFSKQQIDTNESIEEI